MSHHGIDHLFEIKEPFHLILSDCAITVLKPHLSERLNQRTEFIQIQGGSGWHECDWNLLEYCSHVMILNSWANAFSVVDDEDYWETRYSAAAGIIEKLASSKKLLVLDRGGSLHRYWAKTDFKDDSPYEGLGIPQERAKQLGWKMPDARIQITRRMKYHSLIKGLQNKAHFEYYDMANCSLNIAPTGEEIRNVVNNAPWHFDNWVIEAMAYSFCLFVKGKLSPSYFSEDTLLKKGPLLND